MRWKIRYLFVVAVVLFSFLLSACSEIPQGERPTDTAAALNQVQSGTQGVQIQFLQNYPPPTLYDIDQFVALLEVSNKGNDDLLPHECFIQLNGFDPNIIRGIDYIQSCGDVPGKSVYNLDGGFNQIEYVSSNLDLPLGTYEYNPTINAVLCYDYQTKTSPSVCVDPVFYQISSEQKACIPQDVGMGGGQGAPVSVSYVGVDMVGDTAIFEISIRNSAGGRVLSPYSDISGCGAVALDYDDLDKVSYLVEMTGGSLIECNPSSGMVRLNNEAGKIVCKFKINSASAFETPLQITLDYHYLDSIQKQVKIIETP